MDISTIDPNDNIGNTIKFKTQHITDIAPITGTLVSICDARDAGLHTDISQYHVGVEQGRLSAGKEKLGDYSDFRFIVIETAGGTRSAYALEWLDDSGYEVLTSTQTVQIQLTNVSAADVAELLTQANAMDISARVVVT